MPYSVMVIWYTSGNVQSSFRAKRVAEATESTDPLLKSSKIF